MTLVFLANFAFFFFSFAFIHGLTPLFEYKTRALCTASLSVYHYKVQYSLFSLQFAKNPPGIFAIIEIPCKYVANSQWMKPAYTETTSPCSATG